MTRLRATVTFEYEAAATELYGTDDPAEMAAIDQAEMRDDIDLVFYIMATMADADAIVTVEPVE